MKLKNLAFRTQIFLSFLLLITIPITVIGIISAKRNTSFLITNYSDSMETITSQANLTLDTLLQDATKVADLPLLSPDISRYLVTNYSGDDLKFAQDSFVLQAHLRQANRLNQNLITCVYKNKYDYTFDYNIRTMHQYKQIMENIEKWTPIAKESNRSTYFAPLQQSNIVSQRTILPMIKILYNGFDFSETGICYVEINFKSVENIINYAQNSENIMLIYNLNDELLYSSSELEMMYANEPDLYDEFLNQLSSFNDSLTNSDNIETSNLKIGKDNYIVNGVYNKTTEWHLIQISGQNTLNQIYKSTFVTYFYIIIISILFGILLAVVISYKLTDSISVLCQKIDTLDTKNYDPKSLMKYISNKELGKLVFSFNNLNQNLTESIQQNYEIRLTEQQIRIQMLQFQINHHFLYNTLNVIKSIASINNVKDIETIVTCMSELIRYNLDKFPKAQLKEEVAQIQHYMTIQSIRFPNRFIFDCNIPEQFYDYEIPAFMFQPFVENSIEHGFQGITTNCYISITCSYEKDNLHFFIADSGQGISKKKLTIIQNMLSSSDTQNDFQQPGQTKKRSIGIYNVHQRIKNIYGPEYGIKIESEEDQGTIIEIILPLNV